MSDAQLDKIWSLHQGSARARSGMGGYGVAWEIQRGYYQSLPPDKKRQYEDAVLMLCESHEVQKANFALHLCNELRDTFPEEWKRRVITLVEKLVEKGLKPAYEDTNTYAVLDLIWNFDINSLIPFTKTFREQITQSFKQGILSSVNWQQLYNQVSRILIKLSPEEFWEEFDAFYQDRELLNLLGERVTSITFIWSSFGGIVYGLDWLSKLAQRYSKLSDQTFKTQALLSIEKSSNTVLINYPAERESVSGFLERLRKELGDNG